MFAYEIKTTDTAAPIFRADLVDVRKVLRTVHKDGRYEVRLYLVKFSDRVRDRVDNLNRPTEHQDRERVRAWRIGGPRGGQLVELPNLED